MKIWIDVLVGPPPFQRVLDILDREHEICLDFTLMQNSSDRQIAEQGKSTVVVGV